MWRSMLNSFTGCVHIRDLECGLRVKLSGILRIKKRAFRGVPKMLLIIQMVGVTELESVTSTMSTWRSNQLSYTPIAYDL